MSDSIALANLAITVLTKTTEGLSALRERSLSSKDLDIKEQINTLYDNVLQIKEVISRLLDENKDLRRQLEQQQHPTEAPKIKAMGQTNYYYKGDEGPFCQPCYDVDPQRKRLVALSPEQTTPWGSVRRSCPVCQQTFYEKKVDAPIQFI